MVADGMKSRRRVRTYDVCIVGCGLAGSSLAYRLSNRLSVCVIERKRIESIGRKACGEGVHKYWLKDFEPLPEDVGASMYGIDAIELHVPGNVYRTELSGAMRGVTIDREGYVKGMAEKAMDRGCDLIRAKADPLISKPGARVDGVRASGEVVKADVYVDASGCRATIRRKFLPRDLSKMFLGYYEIVEGEIPNVWISAVFGPRRVGWAFHRGKLVNLGSVFIGKGADEAGAKYQEIKKTVEAIKKRIGLRGAHVIKNGMGLVPTDGPIKPVHGNLAAIGDAGCTVNPLTGGGIGPTMRSAKLLADTIRENEDLGNFAEAYEGSLGKRYRSYYFAQKMAMLGWRWLWRAEAVWLFKRYYGAKEVV